MTTKLVNCPDRLIVKLLQPAAAVVKSISISPHHFSIFLSPFEISLAEVKSHEHTDGQRAIGADELVARQGEGGIQAKNVFCLMSQEVTAGPTVLELYSVKLLTPRLMVLSAVHALTEGMTPVR